MKKENILIVVLVCVAIAGVIIYNQSKKGILAETGSGPVKGQRLDDSGIEWKGYAEGLSLASTSGKPVFLYFHADWCVYCKKMEETTFRDKTVQAYLTDNFISIHVDTEKQNQTASQWQVKGLPTVWFLKPDSTRINSLPGYVDAAYFLKILTYIRSGKHETMSFNDYISTL